MVSARAAVRPLALAALLLALCGPILAQTQSKCPPNTFTCKDGSCIPEDWVGDGEPDCDDHSDETGAAADPFQGDAPRATAIKDKAPQRAEAPPVQQQQHQQQRPAPKLSIQPPRPAVTKPESASLGNATDDSTCPWEHQMRVDECSDPILSFMNTVNMMPFENSTLLQDPENVDIIERACELNNEFNICVEGASTACKPDEGVKAWKDVEMYVCQLLVPSVREHAACFTKPRDARCKVKISSKASPLCRLVSSVTQDVACLDQFGQCEDAAKEMLVPIQMESEHIVKDIRCQAVEDVEEVPEESETEKPEETEKPAEETTPEVVTEAETTPKKEVTEEVVIEEVMEETTPTEANTTEKPTESTTTNPDLGEEVKVPTTSSTAPTTTVTTTTSEAEATENEENPFEASPEVLDETPKPTTTTKAPTTTQAAEITESTTSAPETETETPSTRAPTPVTENEEETEPTTESTQAPTTQKTKTTTLQDGDANVRPSIADAIRSLLYIDDVCEEKTVEGPFARLHKFLCEKKDQILEHSECFAKTLSKANCAVRNPTTPCEAIEAFNVNLDCAIIVMNDECATEAQDAVVDIQEQANDLAIEAQCFQEEEKAAKAKAQEEKSTDGFSLQSKLPKCTDNQENGALACLVELVEINKQLAQFQGQNFLLEMASENSSLVTSICSNYDKYDSCLHASVFTMSGGKRCSFASPLNTLARIGLGPLCSKDTRPLLYAHKDCLVKLAHTPSATCQSGLGGLGGAVQKMMQGIHPEALLCKSFYVIRETFECGEKQVEQHCDAQAVKDLTQLKKQMSLFGEEEGCPREQPADLDEVIAKPVVTKSRPAVPIPVRPGAEGAPMARPLAHGAQAPRVVQPVVPACTAEQQKKFQECVQPMTVFQPHPLSVIKMPKQIDEACAKFTEFKECTAGIDCHPLWAKGMSAMFEFACGSGLEAYKEVRQCVRKVAQEEAVKECVATFSRGAPQQACFSANKLLSCALTPIESECGQSGSEFIVNYVTKFALAIDPRCKLSSQIPIGRVVGVGCSIEEDAVIDHCAAPLNDIGARMEEMFQGGLNSLLKNVNQLAPVFAGGCNLTEEFRACAAGPLQGRTPCLVSNCMVKAGEEICRVPDPAKAIDDHLSCLFGQVQEPTFAKCVRSTLSTVKTFSLNSFRLMLPKFTDCVQDIVRDKCGETPIKVLRSISSPDLCPLGPAPIVPVASFTPTDSANRPIANQGVQPVQKLQGPAHVEPVTCTPEKKEVYDKCAQPFFAKYRMLPTGLLNEVDNMDQVCADVKTLDECSVLNRACVTGEQKALRTMTVQICSSRSSFDQYKICLKNVVQKSSACMSPFLSAAPQEKCAAIQAAANCMAPQVQTTCGGDAFAYSFMAMADYARYIDQQCVIAPPTMTPAPVTPVEAPPTTVTPAPAPTPMESTKEVDPNACTDTDYIQLLECESTLGKFGFKPVSIIADGSKWDDFCAAIDSDYKPCVEKMSCKFEPSTTANVQLFNNICKKEITLRDQKHFGECLSKLTSSQEGKRCIAPFSSLDLAAKDTPNNICKVLNSVLTCSAPLIEKQCGYDALLHTFDLHIQYANAYDSKCIIESPEPTPTEAPTPTTTVAATAAASPNEITQVETSEDEPVQSHPKNVRKAAGAISSLAAVIISLVFVF